MKYIVTSSGLEARERNSYFDKDGLIKTSDLEKFGEFEQSVKTYKLTERMVPGSEIEGELIWQVIGCSWYAVDLSVINKIDKKYTRQVLQPIIPQPEKVKDETVEEAIDKEAINYCKRFGYKHNGFAMIAFIAGWEANNEHQHKATIYKVVELTENGLESVEDTAEKMSRMCAPFKKRRK